MSDPQGLYYQQQYEQRRIWEQQQKEKLAQQQIEQQSQTQRTQPDMSGATPQDLADPNAQMAYEHVEQELNPSPKQTTYRKVPKSAPTPTRTLPNPNPPRRTGTPIFDYSERAERLKMEEQSRQAEQSPSTIGEPKAVDPVLSGGARWYREKPTDSPLVEIPQVSEPEYEVISIAGRKVKVNTNPDLTKEDFVGTPTARAVNSMIKGMGESKGSITAYLREASDIFKGFVDSTKPKPKTPFDVAGIGVYATESEAYRNVGKAVADVGVGFVKGGESLVNPQVKSMWDMATDEGREAYFKDIKGREAEIAGEILFEAVAIKGVGVAGRAVGLSGKALVAGSALNVGISQGISQLVSGQPIGVRESRQLAYAGAGETIIGAGALQKIAESGVTGQRIAQNIAGRAVVDAGIDAGIEAVTSRGDAEAIARGALFGAVFSAGFDLAGVAVNEVRAKLPKSLGGVERLELGKTTIGSAGQEIPTYVSKEGIPELEGRQIRVVPDVTEKPAEFDGVTTKSIIEDYTGKQVATAHATLHGEKFDLDVGGKTVLEGFPDQSRGFRKNKELFEFYSAPSDPEVLTIYGGYSGIGKGYSESPPKIEVGGKATVLATLDTEVSPSFLRQAGESLDDYLDRTTRLAGTTGVSQETVLGKSAERQLSTTTKYTRKGEELVGSVFESEGKVATVQIKTKGEHLLDLPQYTNLDIVLGKYKAPDFSLPTKIVNLESYNTSYRNVVKISQPNPISPSVIKISPPSEITSQMPSVESPETKSTSKTIESVTKSIEQKVSYPSVESVLDTSSVPKYVSKQSSKPKTISVPSVVSKPSKSSSASIPSITSIPLEPSKAKSSPKPSVASSPVSEPSATKSTSLTSVPLTKIKPSIVQTPTFGKTKKLRLEENWELDLSKQKLKYPIKSAKQIAKEMSKSFKKIGKRVNRKRGEKKWT